MGALSKYFVKHVSKCSCNDLVHPHSCRRAALQNLFHFALSNMKYYLPMAVLHLLRRSLRGFNVNLLQDTSWYFTQLVSGGLFNGYQVATFICMLRNLLGEFRYSTLVFVPSVLGGILTVYLPELVKNVEHTGIFQSLIESFLLQRGNFVTKLLASSKTLQTLIFMLSSAVVLLGKERRWHNGFWFLAPEVVPPNGVNNLGLYVLQGMRKYLLIGLALDTFKALIGCIKSGHWQLKHFRLESMAWLGCYAGIYRSTLCYLRGQRGISETQLRVLAGFLGGISYLCFPKLTILSYGLLEATRTLWARYKKDKRKRLGISDVMFPLALAYLIHTYVFYPRKISGLGGIIIDSTTANYGSNIRKNLQKLYPFFAEHALHS